jgi:EmrB/QacA subfamily drug resistance transporter
MVILDVSIVNVALPSIRGGLHFGTTGLQWVVNAYTITFGGFLLLGGRLADLLGRRRVFFAGTALFSFGSLLCAFASSRGLLIGARGLQGLGGAVLSPASLSIITTSFAEGRERNRALGVWGAMAGLGGASGALLGGLLTQGFGWPAIFLINVPIGAAVIFAGRRIVPESRREDIHRHFDVAGAVLVTTGLVVAVYGIVRSESLGWGATGVLGPLAIATALLALFALVEGRFAPAPLLPLSVMRMPRLRAANIVIALLYSGVFSMWFFLTLYMQQVLGYSALRAGLAFMPMTLSVATAAAFAPRLVARFGGQLPDERAPGRRARRGRPRSGTRAGDDRGGAGHLRGAERARVRPAQHLAAGRRGAGARATQHDRRLAHLCTAHARSVEPRRVDERLPARARPRRADLAARSRADDRAAASARGRSTLHLERIYE